MSILPETVRDRVLIPPGGPYCLSHSAGVQPRDVAERMARGLLQPWQMTGGAAWPAWLDEVNGFCGDLAALFGGDASDYCPQPNVSAGLAKLLMSGIIADKPPVILLAEESFPSIGFAAGHALPGVSLRYIPSSADLTDAAVWRAAMAGVGLVLVTHVHSNTGQCAPVAEIAAMARAHGAACIVDIAQSAGVVPIDLPTWQTDAAIGSCLKWCCGGPGAGFLWINPMLVASLNPADVGWFSHADPFGFDIHDFTPAPDAKRFWGGTPSVAAYVGARAGLQLIAELGVDAVHAHSMALRAACVNAAGNPLGERLWAGPHGGTLCLRAGDASDLLKAALDAAHVHHDWRGETVRLSFHAFNTLAEAETLGALIGAVLRR